jgi:hypothetical protein
VTAIEAQSMAESGAGFIVQMISSFSTRAAIAFRNVFY